MYVTWTFYLPWSVLVGRSVSGFFHQTFEGNRCANKERTVSEFKTYQTYHIWPSLNGGWIETKCIQRTSKCINGPHDEYPVCLALSPHLPEKCSKQLSVLSLLCLPHQDSGNMAKLCSPAGHTVYTYLHYLNHDWVAAHWPQQSNCTAEKQLKLILVSQAETTSACPFGLRSSICLYRRLRSRSERHLDRLRGCVRRADRDRDRRGVRRREGRRSHRERLRRWGRRESRRRARLSRRREPERPGRSPTRQRGQSLG